VLPQAHPLPGGPDRFAQARPLRVGALDPPQFLEKVEGRRRGSQRLLQLGPVHSAARRPSSIGQRMISPRWLLLSTVSVNELRVTCLAKKRASTAPSRNTPVPWN